MLKRITNGCPLVKGRIAGGFYLLTILFGVASVLTCCRVALFAGLAAGVCYMAVTLIFYDLFQPVSGRLSLLAAAFSLGGFTLGVLNLRPQGVNIGMGFFGLYCLLIGYLIFRSTFLPRAVGGMMALAGVAWLTLLWPSLAHQISPYNMAAGIVGEGSLTMWLLVSGVNVSRWKAQARAAGVAALMGHAHLI